MREVIHTRRRGAFATRIRRARWQHERNTRRRRASSGAQGAAPPSRSAVSVGEGAVARLRRVPPGERREASGERRTARRIRRTPPDSGRGPATESATTSANGNRWSPPAHPAASRFQPQAPLQGKASGRGRAQAHAPDRHGRPVLAGAAGPATAHDHRRRKSGESSQPWTRQLRPHPLERSRTADPGRHCLAGSGRHRIAGPRRTGSADYEQCCPAGSG